MKLKGIGKKNDLHKNHSLLYHISYLLKLNNIWFSIYETNIKFVSLKLL